jgi:endonuclease YncB( thermonuclease family)
MLKAGLATVYEAKSGAEFGKLEDKYRSTEAWAKQKRIGIWSGNQKDFESPRDYKTRVNNLDSGKEEKGGILKTVVGSITSPLSKK